MCRIPLYLQAHLEKVIRTGRKDATFYLPFENFDNIGKLSLNFGEVLTEKKPRGQLNSVSQESKFSTDFSNKSEVAWLLRLKDLFL